MASRGGSKRNYKFIPNPRPATQPSLLGFVKVSAASQTLKEILNHLISEAVNQCKPTVFVQDIVHETVQNVLSSVDIETVAIDETNTPTQRYKFDSAWFYLYPWLKKDEERSKIEDSDFYYCECCRAFGDSAHSGYAS